MASIHGETKMSFEEEEEWKRNAKFRDKLIARKKIRVERSAAALRAIGREPPSYELDFSGYNWLLLPPSLLDRTYMHIPGEDSQASDPMKAATARKEVNGVESKIV
ncbi:hypothetical protein MKW94_019117 [Papaver nudicaule]|uniref:Uncharacterized protein n=1 Tax=Papaver nudicaule TaxID=74823 RepID=A0AA41S241_PAPNU|nr:hypothetical protein [Papaver nudicaule]